MDTPASLATSFNVIIFMSLQMLLFRRFSLCFYLFFIICPMRSASFNIVKFVVKRLDFYSGNRIETHTFFSHNVVIS